MARCLFINQYFHPDEAATSQLLADLTVDLAGKGHQVTVLTGRGRYSCEKSLRRGVVEWKGIQINRVWGTDWGRMKGWGRWCDMISYMASTFWTLEHLPSFDVVVSMSSPPMISWMGDGFARKHGLPHILWTQDIYPELAEKLGVIRTEILRKWLQVQSQRVNEHASRIVVPGRDMERFLTMKRGIHGTIQTIPNWADLESHPLGDPLDNPMRRKWGMDDSPWVMYSGNLGVAHDHHSMLKLILAMQRVHSELGFILVGSTPRHQNFIEKLIEGGSQKCKLIPMQSRESLGDVLGAADVHLVSQKPETNGLLVPSKFYGVVAVGRPVIFVGSSDSELGQIILQDELGKIVEPGSESVSAREMVSWICDSARKESTRIRIQKWGQQHAVRRHRTREFRELIEDLLKEQS